MPFINGIGAPELIIILVIALIVVGPGRLPDVGSALGKSIREFRKAATDMNEATRLDEKPAQPGPATLSPSTAAPVAPVTGSAPPPPPPPVANALSTAGESQPNELSETVVPNTLAGSATPAADERSSVGG